MDEADILMPLYLCLSVAVTLGRRGGDGSLRLDDFDAHCRNADAGCHALDGSRHHLAIDCAAGAASCGRQRRGRHELDPDVRCRVVERICWSCR